MNDRKPVLYINDEKCKNSYSCVRVCPVNAIEVKPQKAHPYILPDKCIGCGLCISTCDADAISLIRKNPEDIDETPLNQEDWYQVRGDKRGVDISQYM